MSRSIVALLTAVILFFTQACLSTSEETKNPQSSDYCCTTLSLTSLRSRLLFPGQDAYTTRIDSYFDIKQQLLTPNCILQPQTSEEVAFAVKTLTAASFLRPCRWAIRSGGHTPYLGASNIEDGVTLDLQYLKDVRYHQISDTVKIGPGARWNDVFNTLEPFGVITTGGRSSTVGVGGLTLGGGISYFSAEHGLICDNVLEFEVVLADGRIVVASNVSHPDLFTVLKGGNNNFGIVTNFKFETFKYTGMWGGLVVYPQTNIQDHFKALVHFSNNVDKNPKASAIVMPVYQSAVGTNLILNAYDYAEPIARPTAFDGFLTIPGNLSDTTGFRNMSNLAQELAGVNTHRVYFGTLTFANDLRVMTKAHQIYLDVLSTLRTKATGDWGIYVLYQPLPPAYWRNSANRGGNVLGLERFDGQVLCLYQPYISWQGSEQDALFQGAGADLIHRIRKYASSIGADNPYLYLDYADKTQDPLASYGTRSVQMMKAAAKKYDPSGVFQNLVPGGFKISQVQ